MPLPPIQALGALAAAAPLAEAAISGVSDSFARLLSAATHRGGGHSSTPEDGSGTGLIESAAASGDSKLRAQTESLLRRFHQLLTGLMDDHNIDQHDDFQLQADAAGQVQIAGSPNAAPKIQDLIGTSPELKQLFDSIVANANLLRLVEESTTGQQQPPVTVVVDAEQASLA
jgi:hypothetical protein